MYVVLGIYKFEFRAANAALAALNIRYDKWYDPIIFWLYEKSWSFNAFIHGLRTPRESFFFENPKLLGSGRQIGPKIWGHSGYFRPIYQHPLWYCESLVYVSHSTWDINITFYSTCMENTYSHIEKLYSHNGHRVCFQLNKVK